MKHKWLLAGVALVLVSAMAAAYFALHTSVKPSAPVPTPKECKQKLEEVRRMRADLARVGVEAFITNSALPQIAPHIHSKYWVDQQVEPDLVAIEKAYRDFGLEIAKQVDVLAVDIFRHPAGEREYERLDRMLRFAAWIGAPGGFENYRIAMRAEEAATMALLRIIMDFSIPDEKIEALISRFTTREKSAPVRAKILYEESGGIVNIRNFSQKTIWGEDAFEARWRDLCCQAMRFFGNRMYEYSKDFDLLQKTDNRYVFFMDDEPGSPALDSVCWDYKLHRKICIYRTQAMFLSPIIRVFHFRKLTRRFPDVKVSVGDPEYETYQKWYDREFDWISRQYEICPSTVAAYYLKYKHNSYTDDQTWWLISKAEQDEITRTNMLKGE